MKPSERINECFNARQGEMASDSFYIRKAFNEISKILDEIFCEHKDSYQVDSQIGDVFYNVCNDCGILFLANKKDE